MFTFLNIMFHIVLIYGLLSVKICNVKSCFSEFDSHNDRQKLWSNLFVSLCFLAFCPSSSDPIWCSDGSSFSRLFPEKVSAALRLFQIYRRDPETLGDVQCLPVPPSLSPNPHETETLVAWSVLDVALRRCFSSVDRTFEVCSWRSPLWNHEIFDLVWKYDHLSHFLLPSSAPGWCFLVF